MTTDRLPTKIEKLVAETKTYLTGVGIETNGKTKAEILDMARAERNKPGKRVKWVPATVDTDGDEPKHPRSRSLWSPL